MAHLATVQPAHFEPANSSPVRSTEQNLHLRIQKHIELESEGFENLKKIKTGRKLRPADAGAVQLPGLSHLPDLAIVLF